MSRLARLERIGRQILTEFTEKNVTFMAAGIAYHALISLAPVLLVVLVVVSAIGGDLEAGVVSLAAESLPGPIADVVEQVFQGDATSPGASLVGIIVLVWGTLKVFRGIDTAFSEIYETTESNSFVAKLLDGLVVLVAVVVAILATVGVTAAFAALVDVIPLVGLLTPLILVAGLIFAFLPMYYRFPNTDVEWDHVFPGAVFAAVGWAALQAVFQVYLTFAGGGSGSFFGGVIVVITWLYFSGLVILLGAVINAVLGGHSSGKVAGVGPGSIGYETRRELSLEPDEFAAYLGALRERLTGQADELGPTAGDGVERVGPPDGPVEVVEQTSSEGEGRDWQVVFRWPTVDNGDGSLDGAD